MTSQVEVIWMFCARGPFVLCFLPSVGWGYNTRVFILHLHNVELPTMQAYLSAVAARTL